MRLFTAILFDEQRKDTLYHSIENLKAIAKGTFTNRDNLHLTVNFIGETKRLNEVKLAMDRTVSITGAEAFDLSIFGVGRFRRREGDIWWIGIEKEDTLYNLQKKLAEELKAAGFSNIEDKEYKPHLTLGRKVVIHSEADRIRFEAGIAPLQMKVEKISLMKSEQIHGKLVYTEIYSVKLKQSS